MELAHLKTLLIDGDGVLWRASEPIFGLRRFFNVLKARGIDWALLTNNSTTTVRAYVHKLQGFGITEATPDQVFTSSTVTATIMRERFALGSPVYVIGESGVKDTLAEAGFTVLDGENQPDQVVAVVVGMDRQISYAKLTVGSRLIRAGAAFIATNADKTFPTPQGLIPGAGSIVAALAAATDREPQVIGKPNTPIFETAMRRFKAIPATTAMLGDRLETDVMGGQRAGIGTILVLSGVSTQADLQASDVIPDLVFDSIAELADALEHA